MSAKIEAPKYTDSKGKRCKYHLPEQTSETEYSCPFEIEDTRSSLCVFHTDKTPKNSVHKKTLEITNKKFILGIDGIIADVTKDSGIIDFRGYQFPKIDFTVQFPLKIDFRYATFNHDVDFSTEVKNPKLEHKYDDYRHLILSNGADFKNTKFKGTATFNYVEIYEDIDFQNAVFEKDAFFNRVSCEKSAYFSDVTFNGVTEFAGANFEDANFSNTTFSQKADFMGVKVTSSIKLLNTTFNQEANFHSAKFNEGNYNIKDEEDALSYEHSDEVVTFIGATFNEKVSFASAVFFCPAEFYDVIFRKRAEFISYDEGHREIERIGMFHNGCYFIRLTLPKDEEFIFFRTDLRKARFHDTNLEKIVFRDVQWATAETKLQKLFRGKTYLLWDEIRPIEGMRDYLDDAKTAENYRQLVINYESKRDYETAEYFHIGEMEMRRKKLEERYVSLSSAIYDFLNSRRLERIWQKYKLYNLCRPFDWLYKLGKKNKWI